MPTGYSRSPLLIKGAFIQFGAPMLVPVPNLIVFQYNPETMTRSLSPWAPIERVNNYDKDGNLTTTDDLTGQQKNALSQPYDPAETFSVVLDLDAADALEDPANNPVAVLTGVADRIAALEMLCYPPNDTSLGGILNVAVSVSIGSGGIDASVGNDPNADFVIRPSVPIVLFFWGPGRIVPVRIVSLSIDEQQYSPTLYPLRAKVTVGLKVLDEKQLLNPAGEPATGAIVKLAKACYIFTRAQKATLATAANTVERLSGILPV